MTSPFTTMTFRGVPVVLHSEHDEIVAKLEAEIATLRAELDQARLALEALTEEEEE